MVLSDIFTPAADVPIGFDSNGNLELQQSCWTTEGENYTGGSVDESFSTAYSGMTDSSGNAPAAAFSGTSEYAYWDFTPQYTIPEADVGAWTREVNPGSATPETVWKLGAKGNSLQEIDRIAYSSSVARLGTLSWRDHAQNPYDSTSGWSGGDLQAGTTYRLRIDIGTGTSSTDPTDIDVVAPADNRFPYTFDNTATTSGGQNILDGPELYPDSATTAAEPYSQANNITSATLDVTMDDTSGAQAIQVTNDGGTTWLPNNGTQTNTLSVTADFMTAGTHGTIVQGRITLSRYGTQAKTPAQGVNGQELQSWTLSIDTNTLAVIDESEYVGSHLENLQALASDGGMLFVPDYRDGAVAVEAFSPGQVTRLAPWDEGEVIESERVETTEGYANRQTVYGAVDQSTGQRLMVTASSQAEIDQHGVVEAPPIFEPRLDSAGDLKSIARTKLAERIANDRITGTITIPPRYVMPGYAYDVPSLARSGETAPTLMLKRVTFGDGVDAPEGRLNFEAASELAGALSTISSDVRSVKRAVK